MNISYKERQITLFPEATEIPDESKRPHLMAARMTLSVENLVILTIVSIMVILFSFSIGVERGKRIALRETSTLVSVGKEQQAPASDDQSAPAAKPFWSGFGKAADKTPDANSDKMKAQSPDPKNAAGSAVKAVAVVPVKTVTPGAGAYTLQLASYKTEKGAQVEASSLKQKGYRDVFVLSKGTYVILCVGNFQKKEEASLFGKKLKGRYQDLRVRSL